MVQAPIFQSIASILCIIPVCLALWRRSDGDGCVEEISHVILDTTPATTLGRTEVGARDNTDMSGVDIVKWSFVVTITKRSIQDCVKSQSSIYGKKTNVGIPLQNFQLFVCRAMFIFID